MVTRPFTPPANPGASATAVIFDNGFRDSSGNPQTIPLGDIAKAAHDLNRVRVVFFIDQAVTFKVEWEAYGSTNLRIMNGPSAAGEVVTASTPFIRDVLLLPGRTKISILTATGPTVWEVSAEGVMFPVQGII